MTLTESPGFLKRWRKARWKHQETFHTPLKHLRPFVDTIVSHNEPPNTARVVIDAVVFEPKHLIALLSNHAIQACYCRDTILVAEGSPECVALLEAALGDWVDFVFIPSSPRFVIFADHDEYTTIFSNKRAHLSRLVDSLSMQGFMKVEGYQRRWQSERSL